MKRNHILFLFLTALFFSCQKENITKLDPTEDAQLKQIEAIISEARAELEADYITPPVYNGEGVSSRSTVYLPAGSVDGLATAIAEAGVNGKVIVKSGDHYESGTVLITHTVRLEGENGANIMFDIGEEDQTSPAILEPAIHVKNCNFTRIKNLRIAPQGDTGRNGIFLENARFTRIEGNEIVDFVNAIWLSDRSERSSIYDNSITYEETVVTGGGSGNWGITIEDGNHCHIKGNHVSNYGSAMFISSKNGKAADNEFTNSTIGILACTVQGAYEMPDGSMLENALPATKWKVMNNEAYNNYWNYLIIDGANNNFFFRNKGWNAGLYDVELAGPTDRFGIPSPTSSKNFVVNPNNSMITKDCGVGNVVLGGSMVSNVADPCF